MDPRKHLAEWVTSHPYFAEAAVNRVWSFFFGRGIVEPVDDFRSTNPPTHPELLKALAKDFRESGYDLKGLMRKIVQSATYQLSATPNESNRQDKMDYSHAWPRPLDAAVLLDAISSVTGVAEKFELHPQVGGGDAPTGYSSHADHGGYLSIAVHGRLWTLNAQGPAYGASSAEFAGSSSHDGGACLQCQDFPEGGAIEPSLAARGHR